jgi:hypothetical protein
MINIDKLFENKYVKTIFAIVVILITIIMFYYVNLSFVENINTHPEVTQIGAPLEFPFMYIIIIAIVAFIFGLLLILSYMVELIRMQILRRRIWEIVKQITLYI